MWCFFKILLLFVLVESSKLKSWKKDPLVAYVYDVNGQRAEKISETKWSHLLQTLKESLHITNDEDTLHKIARTDAENEETKSDLRMCTYNHPCKAKLKKIEESCEGKSGDKCEGQNEEKKKDKCEYTEHNECEEEKNSDECEGVKKCDKNRADKCCNGQKNGKKNGKKNKKQHSQNW